MRVSSDKYELPEIIADTCEELARKCKVNAHGLRSTVNKYDRGLIKTCRYRCIEIGEED